MIQIIKYQVIKPNDENSDEFIERITDNLDFFVHNMTNDTSVTVTYNDHEEVLNIKTLRLNEHTN